MSLGRNYSLSIDGGKANDQTKQPRTKPQGDTPNEL